MAVERQICTIGVLGVCAFVVKENMTPGFQPCRLIIEKSLNSCMHFSGRFQWEDWFPP